ncbi:ground-like domain protein [Dictyocaulus viviparus]|uniref:Ground-like domain protein n=1 Tax=Dictyocaulus viviparus TaxID=29172 RepID=A0A0D8XG81_DICVI|nr:ground-like domain protein [Dictyocaulus viviparus]
MLILYSYAVASMPAAAPRYAVAPMPVAAPSFGTVYRNSYAAPPQLAPSFKSYQSSFGGVSGNFASLNNQAAGRSFDYHAGPISGGSGGNYNTAPQFIGGNPSFHQRQSLGGNIGLQSSLENPTYQQGLVGGTQLGTNRLPSNYLPESQQGQVTPALQASLEPRTFNLLQTVPLTTTEISKPETDTTKQESTYDDIAEEQQSIAEAHPNASTTPSTNNVDYTNEEEVDEGNCDDAELKAIVEGALQAEKDNLEAARKIESDASAKFGGRFNAIVSDAEFAYVNWYGKRNCQLRVGSRHTLTWED